MWDRLWRAPDTLVRGHEGFSINPSSTRRGDDRLKMRCRACGCASPPSPSTGVRPRPGRRGKEASACGAGSSFPSHKLGQACCASARTSSQVIQELACRVQVLDGDPIDKRVVRATVVRAHDDVVLGAHGQAIPLHQKWKPEIWTR